MQLALAGLNDADPLVRRIAAEALGRHPAFENVRPLLDLRAKAGDRPVLSLTSCGSRCAISCWQPGIADKLAGREAQRAGRADHRRRGGRCPDARAAAIPPAIRTRRMTGPADALMRHLHGVARYVPRRSGG